MDPFEDVYERFAQYRCSGPFEFDSVIRYSSTVGSVDKDPASKRCVLLRKEGRRVCLAG